MATKIYSNTLFGFREDTLENWSRVNPILHKGEPAVVRDGANGEWLKIGDGVTPFNELEWKKGPKGEQGIQGIQGAKGDKGDAGADGKDGKNGKDAVTDQTYSPTSENAQSGRAVAEAISSVGDTPKNYELISTIEVAPDENGNLPTSIIFSADSNGKAFQLTDFYVRAVLGATDGTSAKAGFYVNDQAVFGTYSFGSVLSATTLRNWYLQWANLGKNNGALCVAPAIAAAGSAMPIVSSNNTPIINGGLILPSFTRYFPVKKFEIKLTSGTAKTFIAGSKFELWGVRK